MKYWYWTHILAIACIFAAVCGMLGHDGEPMPFWWQGALVLMGSGIGLFSIIWSRGEGWDLIDSP